LLGLTSNTPLYSTAITTPNPLLIICFQAHLNTAITATIKSPHGRLAPSKPIKGA
jgi:hypothetical protein